MASAWRCSPLHRSRLHTSFELQATVSKLKKRTTAPPIVYFIFSIQWFCFDIGLASPYRCLLSKRTVSESQPLITAIPKLAMTKKSFKQVMETAAWSWQILFSGVIPKKDQFGNPVEEFRGRRMRRGVLWSITGGLEWFCQEFNFPWPASNMMCPYCRADQMKEDSKNNFTDFRPCATWRDTILSNSQLKTKIPFSEHLQSAFCR
jgi:hypothetical protein